MFHFIFFQLLGIFLNEQNFDGNQNIETEYQIAFIAHDLNLFMNS